MDKPAPHHQSIEALWETLWKKQVKQETLTVECRRYTDDENFKCSLGAHPFFDSELDDFEQVFSDLTDVRLIPHLPHTQNPY